jgi:hypothetical protein
MDDEDVAQVTPQHVLRQQAYILFYSKITSTKSVSIKPNTAAEVSTVSSKVLTSPIIEVKNALPVIPKQLSISRRDHIPRPNVYEESTMVLPVVTQMKGVSKPAARDESTMVHPVMTQMKGVSKPAAREESTMVHPVMTQMKGVSKPAARDESTMVHPVMTQMKGVSKPAAREESTMVHPVVTQMKGVSKPAARDESTMVHPVMTQMKGVSKPAARDESTVRPMKSSSDHCVVSSSRTSSEASVKIPTALGKNEIHDSEYLEQDTFQKTSSEISKRKKEQNSSDSGGSSSNTANANNSSNCNTSSAKKPTLKAFHERRFSLFRPFR